MPSPNYSARNAGVRLIVCHTAEGALTIESLGNFFASTSVQASSHAGADDKPNTIGVYVKRGDKAWTQANANPYSVAIELCAFASWTTDEWLRHPTMLDNIAQWVAEEAAAFGIPIRELSDADAQAGAAGVCQHVDLGASGGGHWDCGPNFPMARVLDLAAGGIEPPQPKPEVKDMAAPATMVDSLGRSWVFYRGVGGDCVAQCLGNDAFTIGGNVTDAITAVPGDNGTMTVFAYVPEPAGEVWAIFNDGGPDGFNTGGGWWRAGP